MIPLLLVALGLTLTGLIAGIGWAFAIGCAVLLVAYLAGLGQNRRRRT